MPRPMLDAGKLSMKSENILKAEPRAATGVDTNDKLVTDRILRKQRSKEYMNAMTHLDAGGHVHNHERVKEITDAIRNEFPEIQLGGLLIGIVSKCYLGRPYEVHTLDFGGDIIEHYTNTQPLPGGLEKARSIAMRGGYEFIEVYADCLRCIGADGYVAVVPNI